MDFLPRLPGLTVADTGELSSTGGSIDKSNQGVNIPGYFRMDS